MYARARGSGYTFYPQTFNRKSFLSFMKTEYEWIPFEVLDVFFLSNGGFISKRYRYSLENSENVSVQLNELSRHMKMEKPMGIVMVHNHPSGDSSPTPADDEATSLCRSFCSTHGVVLCDHFIYSKNGTFSYRESGVLRGTEMGALAALEEADEEWGKLEIVENLEEIEKVQDVQEIIEEVVEIEILQEK